MTRNVLSILSCVFLAFLSPATAGGQTTKIPDGLHLPQNRQTHFNIGLNDGSGKQWQFMQYLSVEGGINYVYSGGLFCQVGGANIQSNNNMGWMNADGDEIEIGPYAGSNCQIYRRVKVYKDRGLARWLDIFVNTTSSRQTVPVRIFTSLNRPVSRTITSSGADSFGKKDWAFITEHQRLSLLHIVCGERSKLRPTVAAVGQTIAVDYSITIPPGGAAALCYFEAQGGDTAEVQRALSQFNAGQLLNDLPSAVRRLIVNFSSERRIEDIALDRSESADVVILKNDDSISGKITNKEFVIEPFFGELSLPAEKVIGFVAATGTESDVRAIIAGGQVVTGKLKDAVIKLDLPTGGNLEIPLTRIKQCSYHISKEKPDESASGPLILLRTGDRLAFDPADLKCTFQTRNGSITLAGKDLKVITLNHEAHGVHRAEFINGSTLAGILEPEKIVLPLKLGPKLDVSRDMVLAVRFAENDDVAPTAPMLTCVMLNNEDELFGRLVDEALEVATDFGTISVKPENIVEISFSDKDPGQAAMKMWDGSTLRGKIRQETLRFAIQPGPELNLHVDHIVAIKRNDALPPTATVKLVEKYVAMLSAANYKDREESQEALINMGPTIAPLLTGRLKDPDPEVRQRIRNVLEKLGVQTPE